jgi:hypothetical protein
MIILCIDGIDPDLVKEYGWINLFRNNKALTIPKECYVLAGDSEDPERLQPHTTRVWPTIFTGKIIEYGLIKRKGIRKIAHDLLVKAGKTWRGKKIYTFAPVNEELDTVFNHYDSFHWNIPTISPEWIATFPNFEAFERYVKREFMMYELLTFSACYHEIPLQAYYTRYLDMIGHNRPDDLENAYRLIFLGIKSIKEKTNDLIVLSDHGCKKWHTDFAYLGTDHPIGTLGNGVENIRDWIEGLMRIRGEIRYKI